MITKYRAKPVEYNGIRFHSKQERDRYIDLKILEAAGIVKKLRLQVPFILAESVIINGRKRPAMKYKADFVYEMGGNEVVEDSKGFETPEYKLKRHLMKAFHNIDILETGRGRK